MPGATSAVPSAVTHDSSAPVGASKVPDAKAVHRDLEAEIAAGRGSDSVRRRAYAAITSIADDGSASYAYARAAVTGRLAEARGLGAGKLVGEAEQWARSSIQRDVGFDDGAATRLLGTLYVLAPARLVEHGDSETGLEMLEALARQKPQDPRNPLRLAEAYIALGDPDPAKESLCAAMAAIERLSGEERDLLRRLVEDIGGSSVLPCGPVPGSP